MIRAPMGDQTYWDKWVSHSYARTKKMLGSLDAISSNAAYDPQYSFDAAVEHLRLMMERYSRGDPVSELAQHMTVLLDAWELSNQLSAAVCAEQKIETCRDWTFELSDLNHYNWCFWLVGLALSFEVPNAQWQRLLALVGDEGEDVLLDRVIASRSPERRIGAALLHPKPYARVLDAVNAPKENQAALLRDFVDHWYDELKRPAPKNRKAPTIEPFWYIYGDPEKHPLEMGSYFGRWCIEAVAAVKAFGLDDTLCLGHEHYPGDLLRPDGPLTHQLRQETGTGWLARWFKKRAV